jgi:hypothetical protein
LPLPVFWVEQLRIQAFIVGAVQRSVCGKTGYGLHVIDERRDLRPAAINVSIPSVAPPWTPRPVIETLRAISIIEARHMLDSDDRRVLADSRRTFSKALFRSSQVFSPELAIVNDYPSIFPTYIFMSCQKSFCVVATN